jgi:diaminohydroxyphosphoribosylaminopyrimidine deaminase / 5-amino-6-(5-phosphoribosylamino)uracil reductase
MPAFSADDHRFMARALELASRGLYSTHPNPRVGCVIVRQGRIVGEGYHILAGGPHAEIYALNAAGEQARGATVYVSLEPCSHHGKTPPCADALVAAGVSRVVIAMRDPNPLVAGQGMQRLEDAGILTESGLMQAQAARINPGFIKRMTEGLPWVRIKLAMSLDGRTAMASGESQWITGEAARKDVQWLRARSEAVLTGIATVLADDPSLNVRLDAEEMGIQGAVIQPLRVVLDSELRMPPTARMLGLDGEALIFTHQGDAQKMVQLEAAGAEVKLVTPDNGRPDLVEMLKELARREINEVHVEAGAKLCGALLEQGLVDEIVLYVAGHIMGDAGKGLFHLPGIHDMAGRRKVRIADIRAVGEDWRITAFPEPLEKL